MNLDAGSISIVIPTLNAAAYLPDLARAIDAQTRAPSEVLIIDSSSTDGTVAKARSLGWRTIAIPRNEFDHGGTRNLGAQAANGQVLVFMTQDAVPANSEWLEKLTAPLRDSEVGAAFSRQVPRVDASLRERFARLANYPGEARMSRLEDVRLTGIRALFFSNVSSAVRRSSFDEVGGFPSHAILNEDGYFAAKILERGLGVAYEPDSIVVHSHNYGAWMQFKRYFDIGVSHADGPSLMRHASTTTSGASFAKDQLVYLIREKAYAECMLAALDTMAKWAAYNLGRRYTLLPVPARRVLGWNRNYWESAGQLR